MKNPKIKVSRASVIDALPIIIMITFFAIVSVIMYVVYQGFIDAGFFSTLGGSAAQYQSVGESAFTTIDVMSAFVFIGTSIAAFVSALLIRSHPAFFFITLLILMFEVLISVIMSKVWYEIITNPSFASALSKFTVMDTVLSILPVGVVVVVCVLAGIMYATTD
jgi:hypothetical protein